MTTVPRMAATRRPTGAPIPPRAGYEGSPPPLNYTPRPQNTKSSCGIRAVEPATGLGHFGPSAPFEELQVRREVPRPTSTASASFRPPPLEKQHFAPAPAWRAPREEVRGGCQGLKWALGARQPAAPVLDSPISACLAPHANLRPEPMQRPQ